LEWHFSFSRGQCKNRIRVVINLLAIAMLCRISYNIMYSNSSPGSGRLIKG